MKYLVVFLLVAMMLVSACSSPDPAPQDEDPVIPVGDEPTDEEIVEDLLPELVDPDEDVEIGEMI